MIEAYITNLGKYNEGELCGEYLKLPATMEDIKSLLSRIGIDGVLYEETFITDYELDITELHGCLGEYESVDELNYLAALLSDMEESEIEKFKAAVSLGEDSGSVKDLINLTQNLDCYDYFPGIENDDDLGRYLIEELECRTIPEWLENYIDFESYGSDFSINEGGQFTENGYIMSGYGSSTEHYNGRDNIPDEYKIFAYPDMEKMNIHDRLSMYKQMVPAYPTAEKAAPMRDER